ncbi:MBL fold metallo-hydrolase [Nocardioides mesophilus]|uniref:MBL fold metallo-hydrolase n=1 Tax=Nocardioides mesophilus TaxID=433659 RepID=A0A7G9RD22_9ACTN|nr:MBL fold metallo-hydrolase [Nocardioides mesophilus]QNN53497.1 MBL fold metallo-hydrolase [Nocardioides mesophilus]
MRLTVVGCAGSYPGPDSPASCYLLEVDQGGRTWRVVLDLGSGALGALHRYVDPLLIDAVLISHLHADHYFDLSGLYVMWKYHPAGARPPIPVWGPPGIGRQMARAYGLPADPGMSAEFHFHSYDDQPVTLGPFTVRPSRVVHPVPAYGLRIEADGAVLAYSGDTGPCGQLVELAKDADLLLAEAAFREGVQNPADLHLTGADAGRAATAAGVRRLVLTHVPPWYDGEAAVAEARTTYDGPLELATSGAVYEI